MGKVPHALLLVVTRDAGYAALPSTFTRTDALSILEGAFILHIFVYDITAYRYNRFKGGACYEGIQSK